MAVYGLCYSSLMFVAVLISVLLGWLRGHFRNRNSAFGAGSVWNDVVRAARNFEI